MRPTRISQRAGVAAAVMAAALAVPLAAPLGGCSAKKDDAPVDPNITPTDYRTQISQFLAQSLTNRADFRNAQISAPMLKPIGDGQRYMVCVRLTGNGQIKDKVAIYYAGKMSQFVDSTPEQCGDAVYEPFRELNAAIPPA